MNPPDELLADTQRIFEQFADLLTSEESRQSQANIVGFFRLLAKWQSSTEDQTTSSNSDQ
jgi:hypothetical protein